jgi:transcriptional regulator with GAF, ATPase, and Fis domain
MESIARAHGPLRVQVGGRDDASQIGQHGWVTTTRHPGAPVDAVALAAAPYLTRGVELTELLGALVDAVVAQLGAEKGTLYLKDGAVGVIRSVVTDVPGGIRLAIGQGLAGTVAATGEIINLADVHADARFNPSTDQKTGYVTRSMLALPVKDGAGEIIGVLQVLNAARGAFSVEDEASAIGLAQQAGSVLERTSLYAELKRQSPLSTERPHLAYRYNQIVGESETMRAAYAVVEKAGRTDATVLITGESGTGKELFARAIHHNSARRAGPFVKVDCTTLPEALIENELFGHEKGAFTGADKTSAGKFEVAAGGTLFIDEIGELPLKLQAKLLRVLQDREFERVGGTKTIVADVRVVCATHRDLAAMVDAGTFREDLYYRIRVVPLPTPPLRERGPADLLRLIEHFVSTFGRRHSRPNVRIGDDALARLKAHSFPGNIRELEHVIESAVVMCDADVIHARDLALVERRRTTSTVLPAVVLPHGSPGPGVVSGGVVVGDVTVTLQQLESEHIRLVLEAVKGNQSEAARRLGIGRNTLARKLSGEPEPGDR